MASQKADFVIGCDDVVLVTGASGFIGTRVVERLLAHGFRRIRCFVRPLSNLGSLKRVVDRCQVGARVEYATGDLLSAADCLSAADGARVVYHLAAGTGDKSFANAFMNSVVATRNLLDACCLQKPLARFVNVSSFAVYTNRNKPSRRVLDERCPVEGHPELRGEPYCYGKAKQEQVVREYGKSRGTPYVIVRPGVVYGEGKRQISGRVGIDTFGVFLHLGGCNKIPFTYVENCAEAIVLAGTVKGIEGEIYNVVDDDLPSSRKFLRMYKKEVKRFRSIYVPRFAARLLCYAWEAYSRWSKGQLPPAFNRRRWHSDWKGSKYSNSKLKNELAWRPLVPTAQGMARFFAYCREGMSHA